MRFGQCSTRIEVTSHMLCCLFCRNVHLLGTFSQATAQVVGFPCNWRCLHRSLVPRGLNLWVLCPYLRFSGLAIYFPRPGYLRMNAPSLDSSIVASFSLLFRILFICVESEGNVYRAHV